MAYTTIDDPSAHFTTTLYTGSSNTGHEVTNDANAGDFKPDWLWIKNRSGTHGTRSHELMDSSRGANKALESDDTEAEFTRSGTNSFNTNGFTVGDDLGVNSSASPSVAWQWKANGGTTSSNSNGSITSTVQANTTAGFSIVTYTSAAGGQTIGHGLGVKPDMYIIKERTTSGDDWFVYHSALGEGKKLRLSGNSAAESDTNIWQNTAPTTTVAYLQNDGGGVNQNTGGNQNYVSYFFNNIKGYSKFGSYEANNSTDGRFIYTGFKPAWVILKCADSTGNWFLFDNKRDSSNMVTQTIYGDLAAAENTESNGLDFLSNGIKLRQSGSGGINHSGTYIYMAFAEHPFVSSEGTLTTAR